MKIRSGYLFKRKGIYHVQWRVNGKLFMRSTKKSNLKDAAKERDRIMAPFAAGDEAAVLEHVAARIEGKQAEVARYHDEKTPPLKVSDAWSVFLNAPTRPDSGDATLRQYAFQFRSFADWLENSRPGAALRDVSTELAGHYVSHLNQAGISPNTFNKHINLLHLVFRVLKKQGRLTENPWEEIPRKRLATQSRRELTVAELKRVCDSAVGEMRLLFALGIYSGLRLGDCATLRWGEVDLHRRIIRRVPNKIARRKSVPVLIPVHAVLQSLLTGLPESERREYVLPETAAAYLRRSDGVTDAIQAHFGSCGIPIHRPGTGKIKDANGKVVGSGKRAVVEVGFHSLRHTFVSLCREANAPLSVVESIVGHSSPAMTRHYTHTGEAAAGAAVAALPDITGQVKPMLPATAETGSVPKAKVRELAEKLTPQNAADIRAKLLALT